MPQTLVSILASFFSPTPHSPASSNPSPYASRLVRTRLGPGPLTRQLHNAPAPAPAPGVSRSRSRSVARAAAAAPCPMRSYPTGEAAVARSLRSLGPASPAPLFHAGRPLCGRACKSAGGSVALAPDEGVWIRWVRLDDPRCGVRRTES